jgi:hypothetical protein
MDDRVDLSSRTLEYSLSKGQREIDISDFCYESRGKARYGRRPELSQEFTLCEILKSGKYKSNIRAKIQTPPAADLGEMRKFPLEIVCMIIDEMDLQTLTNFRRANRRAKECVDSVQNYQAIVKHIPDVLRTLLLIESAIHIDLKTLYNKLCTVKCEECGDCGPYLYLITCKRVCFLCFTQQVNYLPLDGYEVLRKYALTHRTITMLPSIRNVAGFYSLNCTRGARKWNGSSIWVDRSSAHASAVKIHGSVEAMQEAIHTRRLRDLTMAYGTVSALAANLTELEEPEMPQPPDHYSAQPERFIAIYHTPWLNASTRKLDWGVYCVGCRFQEALTEDGKHRRKMFTAQAFEKHIQKHGRVCHCPAARHGGPHHETLHPNVYYP